MKKNKITELLLFISLAAVFLFPVFAIHAQGLVPPCVTDLTTHECTWGFTQLILLVNKVIKFVLFVLVLPISAIMFAYAGFTLMTSGGEPGKKTMAKKIFSNVAIGLIIAVSAWLIISTILSILGYQGSWIGF